MLTYEDFVTELRELILEGEKLKGARQRDQDPRFRKWRLKLEDLLRRIEGEGHTVNCRSSSRAYGGAWGYNFTRDEVLDHRYNQELQDTLNELQLLVDTYDKYGEPKRKPKGGKPAEPGQVPTIWQLFLALPVHYGWKTIVTVVAVLGALLYGAYLVGVYSERYDWWRENRGQQQEPKWTQPTPR